MKKTVRIALLLLVFGLVHMPLGSANAKSFSWKQLLGVSTKDFADELKSMGRCLSPSSLEVNVPYGTRPAEVAIGVFRSTNGYSTHSKWTAPFKHDRITYVLPDTPHDLFFQEIRIIRCSVLSTMKVAAYFFGEKLFHIEIFYRRCRLSKDVFGNEFIEPRNMKECDWNEKEFDRNIIMSALSNSQFERIIRITRYPGSSIPDNSYHDQKYREADLGCKDGLKGAFWSWEEKILKEIGASVSSCEILFKNEPPFWQAITLVHFNYKGWFSEQKISTLVGHQEFSLVEEDKRVRAFLVAELKEKVAKIRAVEDAGVTAFQQQKKREQQVLNATE